MKKYVNLDIFYPSGILACQNLKEYICLHTLEHLIFNNLSKIFKLNPFRDAKGGISLGYLGIKLRIGNSEVEKVLDYFSDFAVKICRISRQDFLCEKRRLKEEEYLHQVQNWRKLEHFIFAKIFEKDILNYKTSEYLKILEKLKLADIIDFAHSFIEPKNFFIFKFQNNNWKIIKSINQNFKLEEEQLKNFNNKQIKIHMTSLPSCFILLNYFKSSFENIFLYDYLINQEFLIKFFEETIFEEGLAYTYYFDKFFNIFSKVITITTIPTTNLSRVKKRFINFFNEDFVKKSVENFMSFRDKEVLKSKKNFYNKFRPAIINHYLTYKKLIPKREVIRKLKALNEKDFRNFLVDLGTIFISQK